MNFKEWREKYYPDLTNKDIRLKMSHAWASGHVNMGGYLIELVEKLNVLVNKWDKHTWTPSPLSSYYDLQHGASAEAYSKCANDLREALAEANRIRASETDVRNAKDVV